ncbi:MAG TPA: efflux RND transporter periplasmic adaptor subunit, partial [Bacteroidales bacterium]|nr:efflux RND transporter periplasmic adaptor subunit [Bacteroidales bacterium]
MKKIIIAAACAAMIFTSCNNGETSGHAHGGEEVQGAGEHNHGEAGLQLISYNQDFELYAEADPFVVGQASEILAHFTLLSDFSPLHEASVTIRMISEGKEVSQSLDAPDRPGIYSFTITPLVEGPAEIIFDISYSGEESRLAIPDLMVYSDPHDAIHEADEQLISDPNAITFTKEQSWKVDFATEEIVADEFSQVIRTSALVRTAQNDRISIAARTAGIVSLSGDNIFEGTAVKKGDRLLVISGSELAAGNSYVKFIEARNNFEESEANYQRMKVLADDKIVTESAMLAAKRDFETAKALYESLQKNFEGGEQQVMSPINGFVEQIYVGNGDFVDAGQTLLDVARNERLVLMADIPQRFANNLKNIVSANIRNPQSKSI